MPTVAIVGASNDRSKFGNKALRAFRAQGYTVVPINRREEVVEGERAYRSVLDYPGTIDEASVYLPAAAGRQVMSELSSKGIPVVWLNPGADAPEVVAAARAAGISPRIACSIIGIGASPGAF